MNPIQLEDIKQAIYFEWVLKYIIFIVTKLMYDNDVLKNARFYILCSVFQP